MKIVVLLTLALATQSVAAHNTGSVACNGEKERPNVIEPATYTPEEWKKVHEIEGLIRGANNALIKERFSQQGAPSAASGAELVVPLSWDDAKRLILMGYVAAVSQAHNLDVELRGTSGRAYRTKEPVIDAVLGVVRIVDPCGVFIGVSTE